jgi:hypothetical protein
VRQKCGEASRESEMTVGRIGWSPQVALGDCLTVIFSFMFRDHAVLANLICLDAA